MKKLRESLAMGKKMSDATTWWPYAMFRSRFMLQYNLRYGSLGNSLYSRSEYLFQLLPCLEFTFALRKAFGVPAGVGRILNADEVMTYRYDPATRSFTYHILILLEKRDFLISRILQICSCVLFSPF